MRHRSHVDSLPRLGLLRPGYAYGCSPEFCRIPYPVDPNPHGRKSSTRVRSREKNLFQEESSREHARRSNDPGEPIRESNGGHQ